MGSQAFLIPPPTAESVVARLVGGGVTFSIAIDQLIYDVWAEKEAVVADNKSLRAQVAELEARCW